MLAAYARLARLHKPIGIYLLWYPTAWALWCANQGTPSLYLLLLFALGTLCMRSAGCVVNDIADRNVDKWVTRTKTRPLTSGEVSLVGALIFLVLLLFCALLIALQLPKSCFYCALLALYLAVLYPFCKRFLHAPQLVLGFAFSMGIPMAYLASQRSIDAQCWLLMLINILWVLAYDTMYAMADKADDLLIGVRSTAILFASYDRLVVGLLQCLVQGLWLYDGFWFDRGVWFYSCWALGSLVLIYQQVLLSRRDPALCLQAFLVSHYYGLLSWVGLCLS